jgi:hypothetical protein
MLRVKNMTDLIGTTISHNEILERLVEGGMGIDYIINKAINDIRVFVEYYSCCVPKMCTKYS